MENSFLADGHFQGERGPGRQPCLIRTGFEAGARVPPEVHESETQSTAQIEFQLETDRKKRVLAEIITETRLAGALAGIRRRGPVCVALGHVG
jgi:hypothetical protein